MLFRSHHATYTCNYTLQRPTSSFVLLSRCILYAGKPGVAPIWSQRVVGHHTPSCLPDWQGSQHTSQKAATGSTATFKQYTKRYFNHHIYALLSNACWSRAYRPAPMILQLFSGSLVLGYSTRSVGSWPSGWMLLVGTILPVKSTGSLM